MSTPSPSSASGAASGFFLRIRCDPSLPSSTNVVATGGGKRRERDENDDQHSPIEAENGGDSKGDSISQSTTTSSTLPPKRIALDIEGKTYRFKRLTEDEWLQRRVGGSSITTTPSAPSNAGTTGTAQHPVESAMPTTMSVTDDSKAVVAAPSQSKSPEPSHHVASHSPTPSVVPAPQQEGALVVSSSPSPSTTGGAKPPSGLDPAPRPLTSMEVSAKAMPGFEPGDKPADVIKRRNVEQRLKEGRSMRKALRVDAIQTYRLLSGGTNKNVAAKSAEKRGRGDEDNAATVQKTLIGRGVVVTASFANLDKNGAPIVVDKKSDQNEKRRRPVPAVQGRAASSSVSPASTSTALTAFSAPPASTTTIKPNPLRDQIEADLNDYYMTVLAADRRSKLSGRGSLTDYQLDKLLMEMAIRKKEEVTTNLIQGQMQHAHKIQSSVYPPPTVPPSDPPKEAGTAYEANTELAEQYGFGAGRDHGSNYYYALDDGEDSENGDDVFQSSSDDDDIGDEVSDVLEGRFRGKSRYCYQLYTDTHNSNGVAEDDGDYSDGDDAPDRKGGDVEDDFGFTELSVEPHRQHMAEQWNSQPADVAQWNSNYDTHFEERDKKEAQAQAANRQRKPPRTAPLSTIKSYLESASGRGGTSVAETYFVDESYNDGGEPEFVLDDVPTYMSSSGAVGPVGKALGIVKSNIGGEDPEVLYADDDEYDSNAEEHYQGEYPDESPPSTTDSDDDEGIASTDEWDFDGDGAHQHKSNAAAAARRQTRRKKEEAEDDDDSDDEEAEQRYYDPQALGADDGANGMDGFLDDDDDEDVAPRRFAPGGGTAEDDDDFDIEPSAEGILRKKVVYYELPASDDDEY